MTTKSNKISLAAYHMAKKIKQVKNLKIKLEREKSSRFIAEHNLLVIERDYKCSTEVIRNIIKKCEQWPELQDIIFPEINHFLAADKNPTGVMARMSALGFVAVADEKLPKKRKK